MLVEEQERIRKTCQVADLADEHWRGAWREVGDVVRRVEGVCGVGESSCFYGLIRGEEWGRGRGKGMGLMGCRFGRRVKGEDWW